MNKTALAGLAFLVAAPAFAQDGASQSGASSDASQLAQKLSNPVADLISVPFQFNPDFSTGPRNADRVLLNIQPVIPFAISDDWNLLSRTIVPLIAQGETAQGSGSHFGLGDTTQSFFFSPKDSGGIIWGAGPIMVLPTATDATLGSHKWSAGPTLVVLTQRSGWTVGFLGSHVWSIGGESRYPDVSTTFLQPFLGYTWPDTTGLTINTETNYNWTARQWSVPINLVGSRLFKLGEQPVSLQLGARYYAATVADGPRWGGRFNLVLLFPK